MAVATTTRKAIRQAVIARLYPHRYPTTSTTTSAAASANQLNDTTLAGSGQTEDFLRSWIYVAGTAAGSPPVGEVRRVINCDFDSSTSQLIVLPAFTDTINSGISYEVHYIYHPERLHERINAILDNLTGESYIPLTLVPDGEMEFGTTSFYSNTTGAPVIDMISLQPILHGRYALQFGATLLGDTVRTDPIQAIPKGGTFLVSADVFVENTSGDVTMRLLDDDGTTVIQSQDFARGTSRGWQTLRFYSTIPADTEFFHVQFRNNAASGSQNYYIDNIIVLEQHQKLYNGHTIFSANNLITRRDSLKGVMSLAPGARISTTNATNSFTVFQHGFMEVPGVKIRTYDTANIPFRVQLPENYIITDPLFVRVKTNYAALTTDIATTQAPLDIVTDLVLADMFDFMAEEARDNNDLQKMATYRADAVNLRRLLRPRMEGFTPQLGKVLGANNG